LISPAPLLAVFALGLRHGADPDHLAAIDNLTRNAYGVGNRLSRFVGTLFAAGHTVMVLSIAALVGIIGSRAGIHGPLLERIGTWLSIVILIAIAIANLLQLRASSGMPSGVRARFLPRVLREADSPLIAIPVGLLFGLGFETSSQIATYALALGASGGVIGALTIGASFSLGMISTDTLDSLLVHRLLSQGSTRTPKAIRIWIWSVTLMALAVAAYELAQSLGVQMPVPDIAVSGAIVAVLFVTFGYVFLATRRRIDAAAPTSADTLHSRGADTP